MDIHSETKGEIEREGGERERGERERGEREREGGGGHVWVVEPLSEVISRLLA